MRVTAEVPPDLVLVGHVIDAWRLDGGIKVQPYAKDPTALLSVGEWWLDTRGAARAFDVRDAKTHGDAVTARLVGIADRDQAEALKGSRISVSRRRFPVTDDDEWYWVDLIGLAVESETGEAFGTVANLLDNGAHHVFVVRDGVDGTEVERLIPFVDAYVKRVDVPGRRIVVDWRKDW